MTNLEQWPSQTYNTFKNVKWSLGEDALISWITNQSLQDMGVGGGENIKFEKPNFIF